MAAAWPDSAAAPLRTAKSTSITRRRWTRTSSRNLRTTACAEVEPSGARPLKAPVQGAVLNRLSRECVPEGELAMSLSPAKRVSIAILSLFALGVAFSFHAASAEEATEDQILRALTPAKPQALTRSLSMRPPA